MGVGFRYAALLSVVRYSVGARHSLFAKIRLHVLWGPPSLLQWVLGCFVEVKPSEQCVELPPLSSVQGRTEQSSKSTSLLLLHGAKQEELYVSTAQYTTDYSNIYSQNLENSEERMFIIGQIYN